MRACLIRLAAGAITGRARRVGEFCVVARAADLGVA